MGGVSVVRSCMATHFQLCCDLPASSKRMPLPPSCCRNPLIKSLQAKLPSDEQNHFRSIVTDDMLQVGCYGNTVLMSIGLDSVAMFWAKLSGHIVQKPVRFLPVVTQVHPEC
jgi:hypothetical protein